MYMSHLINRISEKTVEKYLEIFPCVVILGSRQCGKSTLMRMFGESHSEMVYLDLQSRMDLNKIQDPSLFFRANEDKTICLDEIQLVPELFDYLRTEIDRNRRHGRFVLLGSASANLIQKTSESLAGRVGLIDLTPFTIGEIDSMEDYTLNTYWFRGGYPDAYRATSDESCCIWRENFIRTYLERDIPQLGFTIAAPKMLRLLTLLAHSHGELLNATNLANIMDVSAPTIRHYIDIMESTYIVRTLSPYYVNIKKRLTKTPRLYVRDSGLLHQILGIQDFNALMGHPVFGHSWEGMVLENVCAVAHQAQISFYRTASGNEEMDIVVQYPNKTIAIECKASTTPTLTDGFWKAIETLQPNETYVVCPIRESYSLREHVQVIGLEELVRILETFS